VLALLALRPRETDGTIKQINQFPEWIAPLHGALLLAARAVLPRGQFPYEGVDEFLLTNSSPSTVKSGSLSPVEPISL
jgi:hypothetical protein